MPAKPLTSLAYSCLQFDRMQSAFGLCVALILAIAPAALLSQADSYAAHRQEALVLEQAGKDNEAEAAWKALLPSQPNNPEPYAHLGLINARQQNFKDAVPLYRKALALNPNVPGLRLNLALALFKSGQMEAAIPEFEALLKSARPSSPEAERYSILLGMSHYGVAHYAEAVPLLQKAAVQDPQNLPLRLALAHSCLWSKQYQCVMDVYKQILSLNAASAEADMLAGEALDEMKDNEGSTKMFRAAAQANPKEPNVHFGLGYLLWTQKQYPEAATEFNAELANDPMHAQSMLYLGDTYLQLNNAAEAQPLLEKAAALDSTLWLAFLDLGIIDSDAGRNDQALSELQRAEKLKGDDVNVHWRLGRLYRSLGRKDEAKVEFDKASKLNKTANEDLYKKIAGANQHQGSEGAPPAKPVNPQ